MLIDCFPYFNEKELLELRINLLEQYVDKFIICDADHTHSGIKKNFSCKKTISDLGLKTNKIEVLEINLPSFEEESNAWVRERMQRDYASEFIGDDDVAFVSDCDEIIDPNQIKFYEKVCLENPDKILRVPMVFLNARANLRVVNKLNEPIMWNASYFCLNKHLKKYTLSEIRESYSMEKKIDYENIFITIDGKIKESGWHFSWMGDNTRRKTKCKSFLHFNDYVPNTIAALNSHEMEKYMDNYLPSDGSVDPLGRDDHILREYNVNLLPREIFKLKKVKEFLIQ